MKLLKTAITIVGFFTNICVGFASQTTTLIGADFSIFSYTSNHFNSVDSLDNSDILALCNPTCQNKDGITSLSTFYTSGIGYDVPFSDFVVQKNAEFSTPSVSVSFSAFPSSNKVIFDYLTSPDLMSNLSRDKTTVIVYSQIINKSISPIFYPSDPLYDPIRNQQDTRVWDFNITSVFDNNPLQSGFKVEQQTFVNVVLSSSWNDQFGKTQFINQNVYAKNLVEDGVINVSLPYNLSLISSVPKDTSGSYFAVISQSFIFTPVSEVPEPSSYSMMIIGLLGMLALNRRKRKES